MYDSLAAYYDKFMNDVPYAEWIAFLEGFLGARGRGRDVGCGTGKFTVGLKKDGYDVTGSDPSREMLSIAAANARAHGVTVPFLLQSAEKFYDSTRLDFIVAMCDVVNYIKKPEAFFAKAYASLRAGGVLVFDVSSEYKLTHIIGENVFTDTEGDVTYIWENRQDKRRRCVDMRLTFFERIENNYYSKSVDEQTQYVYTEAYLRDALAAAGFADIKTYGFLKKRPPSPKEQRIHFVAHK